MPRVLIVEDQSPVATAIAIALELGELEPVTVSGPSEALAILERGGIDLVIQDMNFTPGATSGTEGIELFRTIRERYPQLPVLLMTAWASVDTAVQLMKEGAGDYLTKPWDDERLLTSVRNLLKIGDLERENRELHDGQRRQREELARRYDLCALVYSSAAMHEVVSLAVRVASADVPVLITGANGTGKERIAQVIHANSPRRKRPLVSVNVGALPDTLLEAELFGAEAGAFTGATGRRIGRFEAAHRGTLLLDEIGNLSPAGQAKLLRVLETGELQRLGSSESVRTDVRVLAATNTDLRQAIDEGSFREDLLFRLNVITIELPALADRREDVLPLAESFVRELAPARDGIVRPLTEDAQSKLRNHPWPGNVRELRNVIQRATLVANGPRIEADDLGLVSSAEPSGSDGATTEQAEVEAALRRAGGVVSHAAEDLGISRQALYRKMERLGITVERRVTE
jgi:DNA-binding NtrC family response regulator